MEGVRTEADRVHWNTLKYIRQMRINTIIFLLTALLTASGTAVMAQEYHNTPVTVSSEKVRHNGKICYSHIVLEKQTLFSISKAYGVSVEDIYRYNPTLRETGLKKNSIIIIPTREALQGTSDATEAQDTAKREEPKTAAAPAEQEVKKEEAVQVEEKKAEEKKQKKEEKKRKSKQRIHVTKWYEDLDTIADKYGVSVKAIMEANNLTGRKLSSRQKLIIPDPEDIAEETVPEEIPEEAGQKEETPTEEITDTVTVQIADTVDTPQPITLYPKETVTATLLLPLNANGATASRNNMDFYSGVLLAVNDLAEEGISTDLNVYDISGGEAVTEEELEGSDLVIGPVSAGDIGRYFGIVPHGLSLISPLDPRADRLVSAHSNMVQAPTPHEVQYQDLIAWLKEDMTDGDSVVMITEKGVHSDVATAMKSIMDSTAVSYHPFSYSILEGRDVTRTLSGVMTPTGINRVVIGSDNEAFVNDVVRNLNLLIHRKLNIVLYGTSKIRGFETIESENFHNTSMHVSLSYYIDYEDARVKAFLMKYRALFNTEPTQFAFQGYDIAEYFIPLAYTYGKRWPEMLSESEKSMLQSTFRCLREGDGGFVNHGIRRIVYGNDWNIVKVL